MGSGQQMNHFVPIAVSILYPTIYHNHEVHSVVSAQSAQSNGDQGSSQSVQPQDQSLLRKSALALDAALRDYELMNWQLNLLLELHQSTPMTPQRVIAVWKRCHGTDERRAQGPSAQSQEVKREVLSQSAWRLFLEALLSESRCD